MQLHVVKFVQIIKRVPNSVGDYIYIEVVVYQVVSLLIYSQCPACTEGLQQVIVIAS